MTQFSIVQIDTFLEHDRIAPPGYKAWRDMNAATEWRGPGEGEVMSELKRVRMADDLIDAWNKIGQLEAINAELLASLELAEVSALKLAHMAFVCSAYAGRMNDIRGEVDGLRVNVTAAIAKVRVNYDKAYARTVEAN